VLGFEPMTYGSESECATHYTTAPTVVAECQDLDVEYVPYMKNDRQSRFRREIRSQQMNSLIQILNWRMTELVERSNIHAPVEYMLPICIACSLP